MTLPTDSIGLIMMGINLAVEAWGDVSAYERIANGISAKAQAENRDVTDDEMNLIKAMQAESERRRRGGI